MSQYPREHRVCGDGGDGGEQAHFFFSGGSLYVAKIHFTPGKPEFIKVYCPQGIRQGA